MAETDLKTLLQGKVAILGFGNRLWGDDGAGSVLAERLKAACPEAPVFDGGMVPENYLEQVAATNPDTILLIDSADFRGEPGEWRAFSGKDLVLTGISTHAGSPRMLATYLEERTKASIVLIIAIQGSRNTATDELSPIVGAIVNSLTEELKEVLG